MNSDQSLEVGHYTQEVVSEIQQEEAVIKAGALQNAIFNSANFSSIATDAKGVIQIFNVGAERMLGYLAEEVMNTITPAEISDPQELITRAKALSAEFDMSITPGFEALVFKASRGIEDIYELTYIRKDASRFPAVVSVTALRDIDKVIIGYLLIGTDNTARKQVEAEQMKLDQRLRDQQFYTRSLIESNIDALMTTDPAGIITDVNKQMEALTGCTRDELIGAPFKSYFTDPARAEAGIKLVLNDLFTRFDHISEHRGLEKIKTIGDCYMAAAGLPVVIDDHADRAAYMALDMLDAIGDFNLKSLYPLNIRIGISSGAAVAGVIGKSKFVYDLWGDVVNTASRMESHGDAGRIQISESVRASLTQSFSLEHRGLIEVKGKGEMSTWYLNSISPFEPKVVSS
jgi:PAS domain-containing protein